MLLFPRHIKLAFWSPVDRISDMDYLSCRQSTGREIKHHSQPKKIKKKKPQTKSIAVRKTTLQKWHLKMLGFFLCSYSDEDVLMLWKSTLCIKCLYILAAVEDYIMNNCNIAVELLIHVHVSVGSQADS